MKSSLVIAAIIIVILVGGFFVLNSYIYGKKQGTAVEDYKDAEYIIEGARVKLTDGIAKSEAMPGSASKIVTRYFRNEAKGDLNGDGREDVVFLLTQETGGSGTFYYAVAALNTERGYVGSDAFLLGDRIAPYTTEFSREAGKDRVIIVNYADRAPGEDFSVQPSVGKSIWILLDPETMQFGEVVQNFEGEADPSRMKLDMKTWNWISALYNDGREIKPKTAGAFTLTLGNDGRFSATTDCNTMSGDYKAVGNTISFGTISSTKKYCAGSQESDFATLLRDAQLYHFTSRGELVVDFKFDSGSVIFR